tara:strand:+ start:182 stop:937 length:756 start_codon:yes stop_codon:yes gene_type:complete
MRAIIIAAGLGSRLKPYTNNLPKVLVKIGKTNILKSQLKVFRSLNIQDINLIVGHKKEKFKEKFKEKKIKYFFNKEYKKNNILESLFYARSKMNKTCLISYSDIIFKRKIVKKLLSSKSVISILVDTDWKKNYKGRTMHPISQAENVIFDKKRYLKKAGKYLSSKQSQGEFIGMLKINSRGCRLFKKYFNIAKFRFKNKKFYNAKSFKTAYLTDFFNFLIEHKITIKCINIRRNWMEIDTVQDLKKAKNFF